jgi:hypothetical protein
MVPRNEPTELRQFPPLTDRFWPSDLGGDGSISRRRRDQIGAEVSGRFPNDGGDPTPPASG